MGAFFWGFRGLRVFGVFGRVFGGFCVLSWGLWFFFGGGFGCFFWGFGILRFGVFRAGVQGLGFRVWGLGFRVWGLGFGVWGLGFVGFWV